MCITDKLKEEGFVSTKNLSDWQEQQLQDAVRKGEAVRLKNAYMQTLMPWQIPWWIYG